MNRNYSTVQVARMVGVDKQTLLRWLWAGKIPEPRAFANGGQKVRLWKDRDVKKVREYKEANYRKGRGLKKKQRAAAVLGLRPYEYVFH